MSAATPLSPIEVPMLRLIVYALLALGLLYAGVLAYFYVEQRAMLFAQDRTALDPAAVGLPEAKVERLTAADGTRLAAWFVDGRGPDTVLYFHGNGGALATRASRIRQLTDLGLSVLAVEYRGYGASEGSPSEAGFAQDAEAAYASLRERGIAADHILLYGESMGSGVAVALAARRPVAGVILDAPFSSVADVAADLYWMLPVRWLLRDPFHSDRLIGKVEAPVLILHGDGDTVVPIRYGERLQSLAGPRATFVRVEGGGHMVLQEPEGRRAVADWLVRIGHSPMDSGR